MLWPLSVVLVANTNGRLAIPALAGLLVLHQTVWQYSDAPTPNGGIECKGYEKIAIFDQYLALSRK